MGAETVAEIRERLGLPVQGIQFERFTPTERIIIDAAYLAEFGLLPDYDFRTKLGPSVLHEATEEESASAAEKVAKALVKRTGQTPDIMIVSASHLPPFDPDNPDKQQRANQVRESLIANVTELGLEKPLAPANLQNTHTVSTACSGFVVALDWLRQKDPKGQSVLIVVDETGYRRTLPPPEEDSSKSRLILSDRAIAMQFTYGEDLMVEASTVQHEKDTEGLLRMRTPNYHEDDTYLTVRRPPYADQFEMVGPELKRYFGRINKANIAELLGPEVDIELATFVLHHQASIRMVDGLGTFGIGNARHYGRGILKYGNTSSASIPFDLQDGLAEGKIQAGDIGLLVGYGAGLTWTAALVRL
ncbi:MAG: hypothetical protein HYW63_01760 [Candidatus Levybacteria bacterium]|nr:hypothetical protein [Candidatus Levybacteria bacterium]